MPNTNVIKKSALSPTVLIVGGAGFVGSHLAEALLLKDARVIVVDNFSTGKQIYVNKFLENPKFALFEADINVGLPKEIESVDYVYHLAGLEAYLTDASSLSYYTLLTNSVGTKVILDFCKACNAKFMLASLVDVYKGLISPAGLDHYYGTSKEVENKYTLNEAKRYAEALTWEYYKEFQSDVRIARFSEIYGPRMSFEASGSLGKAIKNTLENTDIVIYGDGVEKENYIYISDAVSGLVKGMFSDNTSGEIFTFISEEYSTVLETAYLLKNLASSEIEVTFKPKTTSYAGVDKITLDSAALKKIKWSQKVYLKEGLKKTLESFGYDVSSHSFKPASLISKKKNPKSSDEVKIDSLVDETSMGIDDVSIKPGEKPNTPVSTNVPAPEDKNAVLITSQNQISNNPSTIEGISTVDSYGSEKGAPVSSLSILAPEKQFSVKSKPNRRFFSFRKTARDKSLSTKPSQLETLYSSSNLGDSGSSSIVSSADRGGFLSSKKVQFVLSLALVFLAFLIVFVIMPGLQIALHAMRAEGFAQEAISATRSMRLDDAISNSEKAFNELYRADAALSRTYYLFKVVGREDLFTDTRQALNSGKYSIKSIYFLASAGMPLKDLWDTMKPTSENPIDTSKIVEATEDLEVAKENLQLAAYELDQIDYPKLKNRTASYKEQLQNALYLSDLASPFLEQFPSIIGVDGTKSYLVLFQNNNELRPTGGFIGSYAVVNFKDGKIASIVIDDVYNPDGQIALREIKIDSPAPIKTYLQEDSLFIRNANWYPEFSQSAEVIKELFFKVDGRNFDGVFAVDLNMAKEFLEITGPIFLTAYNEEITAQNIYERTQFHSEFTFEAGSEQKKTFLTVMGGKLLESVFGLSDTKLPKMVLATKKLLDERHLMVYLPGSSLGTVFNDLGWDGAIRPTGGDYLQVVNANLGGTKANYYIKNEMAYSVTSLTRDGVLRARLELLYDHTGTDSAWPGGPYTNYVRIITPEGTFLTGAKISANDVETNVFDSVVAEKEGAYNSFGVGFKLDPQKKLKVIFEYDLPEMLNISKENGEYSLYWQKQPGTNDDLMSFSFDGPFGTSISSDDPRLILGSLSGSYSGYLNTDFTTSLKIN
ncbi:DUF4012 domain-containing protein [Candidatus Nomurabacteria bacterium]|uniref:DUF4012 domain-containing protein n=1 Tax=candidate division WWE3 bacterium TaxID=2053526 RepID=A0A955E0X5_UNCKA|nr:DUF4012 domain-containing protein [candidate division WWE3 bacterium]MCB9823493.1 DUF4012 domain-containing protein [Candidatus Nomurabacteria bacterium]MCB9827775.1 DUF4012 domain-containing protein [Candidatus Nomurabacteria bacterium]HXK52380.1 NAD-dependent epimerase/dehydratase family protein [bacterium]